MVTQTCSLQIGSSPNCRPKFSTKNLRLLSRLLAWRAHQTARSICSPNTFNWQVHQACLPNVLTQPARQIRRQARNQPCRQTCHQIRCPIVRPIFQICRPIVRPIFQIRRPIRRPIVQIRPKKIWAENSADAKKRSKKVWHPGWNAITKNWAEISADNSADNSAELKKNSADNSAELKNNSADNSA